MQFGLSGHYTTDAIIIVRQLQQKVLARNRNLHFAFIDPERSVDNVSLQISWRAISKLRADE